MIWLLFLALGAFCEEILQERLVGESLEGTWTTINKKHHIFRIPEQAMIYKEGNQSVSFFRMNEKTHKAQKSEQEKGDVEALFYYESSQNSENRAIFANYLFLRLYYPKYKNGRVVELNINLKQGFNKTLNAWKVKDIYTAAVLYENLTAIGKLDIEVSLEVIQNKQHNIEINLKSEAIQMQILVGESARSFSSFFWLTIINLIQLSLLFCYYQMRNRNILYNTSEWLLLHGCCFLFVQALLYLLIATSYFNTSLKFLLVNTVLNITVMLLLLRKFQAVIEKFKNILNLIFAIIFVLSYIYLVFRYYEHPRFWVLESMIFLWQISHSMKHGVLGGASLDLILIILFSRFPLWNLIGSDNNLLRLIPSYPSVGLIFLNTIFHLFVIGLQYKFGGRFMIPKTIIPDYHDYYKSTYYESDQASSECPICLNQLRKKPQDLSETSEQKPQTGDNLSNAKVWYASAPCKHTFHPKCLGDWMKQRLVCPICRYSLPPMNATK